jgi:Cutinase
MDDVIRRLNSQSKACADQRFALVGYSQGAGVIHGIFQGATRTYPNSTGKLPVLEPQVIPKILAIVTFGDPGFMGQDNSNPRAKLVFPIPKDLQAKTMINCSHGDPVFVPGFLRLASLYANNELELRSSRWEFCEPFEIFQKPMAERVIRLHSQSIHGKTVARRPQDLYRSSMEEVPVNTE